MIIVNGKAQFIRTESNGYDENGDPIADTRMTFKPVDCNISIKEKTNTAGSDNASFARAAYEILTEDVPAGATFVILTDALGRNLGECQIQYSAPLSAVGAIRTIAYADKR